jgi:drug/metabolite transporter (DMT)-like permease
MKSNFFKKFLSRKFLIAVVGTIVGLAISLGADASEIQQIAGAVVSAISAVGYIFGEAMVDVAAVKKEEPQDYEEEE